MLLELNSELLDLAEQESCITAEASVFELENAC